MTDEIKMLNIDFEKCTGCRLCELVCSVSHDGISNPIRSRIRVIKWEDEGVYVPMTCQQCEDAPCLQACPVKAISHNEQIGRLEIDYDICIGCRTCVTVCPFGAMTFNRIDRRVIKCDLCDGEPQCVRFCDIQAIEFVTSDRLGERKKRVAAELMRSEAPSFR